MALIDKIQDSNLGLKGRTPAVREGATQASKIHVEDPTPGSQGDEIYSSTHSRLDLDGQVPKNTYRNNAPEGASF